MARLDFWSGGRRTNDYKFMDNIVKQQLYIGGTALYVHKYLGIFDQGNTGDLTQPSQNGVQREKYIQDILLLENRDREYSPDIYEIKGHYSITDNDFDLTQFGIMLASDTIFIVVHLNDMIERIGRKFMCGDVLELPHLRDDTLLDENASAVNRFYVVQDSNRASEGYGPHWWPHLWRLKCTPMTNSPEYRDILNNLDPNNGPYGTDNNTSSDDLKNFLSTYQQSMGLTDAIIEQATAEVPKHYFESAQLYCVPQSDGMKYPYLYCEDGKPPNGAQVVGTGAKFPQNSKDQDFFLRTDYVPNILFQKQGNTWIRIESDNRHLWKTANSILERFINNENTTTLDDGRKVSSRQDIKKVVKPRANV